MADGYAVSSLDQMGEGYGFRKTGRGGVVRVDAGTDRRLRKTGSGDAIVVVAGGKDGYVGRDGVAVGDRAGDGPPGAA
jgi:hypothetical protein